MSPLFRTQEQLTDGMQLEYKWNTISLQISEGKAVEAGGSREGPGCRNHLRVFWKNSVITCLLERQFGIIDTYIIQCTMLWILLPTNFSSEGYTGAEELPVDTEVLTELTTKLPAKHTRRTGSYSSLGLSK